MPFDIFLFRLAEGGGLATVQTKSAPLNAFPSCSPQRPLQISHSQDVDKSTSFFLVMSYANKFATPSR